MKKLKALLLSISLSANTNFAALKLIDKIAVVVNNDIILESDINNFLQSMKLTVDQTGQKLPDRMILRHQILERLISDQIILQIGQKMGIKITEKQLDQTIFDIAQHNNMSIHQIRSYLTQGGIDYDIYRSQIKKEILISKVRDNEIHRRITISPKEVNAVAKQLSQQNKNSTELYLSYILISLPKNPTVQQITAAKNKALFVIEQARKGINFDKLAIMYSTNHQTPKVERIALEDIKKILPVFSEDLNNIKKGDTIGPIRSIIGFYILKINDLQKKNYSRTTTVVHARHILLKPSADQTDYQIYRKLQKIAFDIRNGKISFTQAAKNFSQDPASFDQGGDLGWVNIDTYDVALRETLMKLKKGEISTPVRSSVGWHLIEMLNTHDVEEVDENRQKERAYRILFNHRLSEETEKWIEEQRTNSYIRIFSD